MDSESLNNDDPGAVANAASRIDMTFVATDTLSELVWYPQKGLRLRCADGSISNKNGSLLWGIVPANTASGLSSDMPISNTEKATSKRNFMASLATCNLGSEVSGGDDSTRFPTSDAGTIRSVMLSLNL